MNESQCNSAKPNWLGSDERKADRKALHLPVRLSGLGVEMTDANLQDVSSLGCRLLMSERSKVGTFLTIAIAGFTRIEGWIAWRKGEEAGVDFAHALPQIVVDHLVQLGST